VSDPERLHHVLLLTDDLEATRAFYCDVLGFEVVESPPLPFTGFWLSLGGDPCIHVAERSSYAANAAALGLPPVEGPADHVAFRRRGWDELLARLEAAGVEAVENEVPGLFRQVFVTDPNGLRVELNVPESS
jgi:catechol 2,3-dioxygenase-like lactoylglutathione lyase family enzyme